MQLLYIKTKPADATQAGHLRFTLVAPLPPPLHRKFRKSVQPIKIINCNENTQAIHVYQHPVNSRINGFLILVDIRHMSRRPARISKLIQQQSVRYSLAIRLNADLKLAPTPLQETMLMFVMCEITIVWVIDCITVVFSFRLWNSEIACVAFHSDCEIVRDACTFMPLIHQWLCTGLCVFFFFYCV